IEALATMDMLGIIFFAVLFGATLTQMGEPVRERLTTWIDAVFQTMMKLTGAIIRLAPIGVFGLIFTAVYKLDGAYFKAIALYMITIAIGLSLHFLVVLPLIYFAITKRNPLRHYRHMASAILTAFST